MVLGLSARFVQFAHPVKGRPLILLSVVVSNVGARTGVIDYLYLVFGQSNGTEEEHNFWAYTEPADAEPRLALPDTLDDLPNAFAVEPGESVKKLFYFIADQPDYRFSVGDFDLQIKAVAAGKRKHLSLQRQAIRVVKPVKQGQYVIGGSLQKTGTIVMGPPGESG